MKVNWIRVGGAVLAVSSAVALWISVESRIAQDRFIHCVTNVVNDHVNATSARTGFAEQDRLALKQVFLDVAHSTGREQTLAAITRYNTTIAKTEELRGQVKIPQPPSVACD